MRILHNSILKNGVFYRLYCQLPRFRLSLIYSIIFSCFILSSRYRYPWILSFILFSFLFLLLLILFCFVSFPRALLLLALISRVLMASRTFSSSSSSPPPSLYQRAPATSVDLDSRPWSVEAKWPRLQCRRRSRSGARHEDKHFCLPVLWITSDKP